MQKNAFVSFNRYSDFSFFSRSLIPSYIPSLSIEFFLFELEIHDYIPYLITDMSQMLSYIILYLQRGFHLSSIFLFDHIIATNVIEFF